MTKLAECVDVAFIFSGTPSPTTPPATRAQSAAATGSDLAMSAITPKADKRGRGPIVRFVREAIAPRFELSGAGLGLDDDAQSDSRNAVRASCSRNGSRRNARAAAAASPR